MKSIVRVLSRAIAWASLCVMSGAAYGESIPVGFLSFDVLTPEQGQQLGVNVLNIANFTGSSSLAPDFPVLTAIRLNTLQLTLLTPSGSQVVTLGSLDPGYLASNPELEFASNFVITSVTLSASVTSTAVDLAGRGTRFTQGQSILYVLAPATGSALNAGIDAGVLSVEVLAVPEPQALAASVAAVVAAMVLRKRMNAA